MERPAPGAGGGGRRPLPLRRPARRRRPGPGGGGGPRLPPGRRRRCGARADAGAAAAGARLRRVDTDEGGGPHRPPGQLPARQDVPLRPGAGRRERGVRRQLQLHPARARLRRRAQYRTQRRDRAGGRPRRAARLVRRVVERRRAHRRREGRGAGGAGAAGPSLGAGVRLLQDAVPRLRRAAGRARGGGGATPGRPPIRHRDLAAALRLPARGREERHRPPAPPQRLHPRRQRRPRQDVDRAGGDQVLRDAQRARARPLPQTAGGQLGPLHRPGRPAQQPVRERPVRLRRPRAHRPEPVFRQGGRGRSGALQLGRVRPGGHRRIAQFPQRGPRPRGRGGARRPPQPLQPAAGGGREGRRADQGADAVGDPGQHEPARPAQPDLPDDRKARRRLPRRIGHRRPPDRVRRGAARLPGVGERAPRGREGGQGGAARDSRRGLPGAARRGDDRPLARPSAPLPRRGDGEVRRLPRPRPAREPPPADRPRGRALLRRAARPDRRIPALALPPLGLSARPRGARRGEGGAGVRPARPRAVPRRHDPDQPAQAAGEFGPCVPADGGARDREDRRSRKPHGRLARPRRRRGGRRPAGGRPRGRRIRRRPRRPLPVRRSRPGPLAGRPGGGPARTSRRSPRGRRA